MKKKNNIIIIKTDQHRFNALSCMGHKVVKTPNIDKLASEACLFENAFCVSPLCVPSRVSFFTGQYLHRTGAISNAQECHIDSQQFSFIRVLKEVGYTLGLAGKNHAFQDGLFEDYFDYREEYSHHGKTHGEITEADKAINDYRRNDPRQGKGKVMLGGLIEDPEPFPEDACMTSRIAEDAITFIKQNKENPFFLHLSFPDPHWPNLACEPYHSMYNPEEVELEGLDIDWTNHPFAHFVQSQSLGFDTMTEEERKKLLAVYYGQITFIDKAVGTVLEELNELNLYDDTIIVFTSDHGDFAGHFGLVEKTKAFYDSLLRIPLIIKLPNQVESEKVSSQVSNIDVMPTIADYLGISVPECVQGKAIDLNSCNGHRSAIFAEVGEPKNPPKPMPHAEFNAYAEGRRANEGDFWFIDYTVNGRAAMIRKDNWKYCYYTGDSDELYNLETDPLELQNLASDSVYQDKRDSLKNKLMEWLLTEPVI